MSLSAGDSRGYGRDKSPGRRDERGRSRGRYQETVRETERTRVEVDRDSSPPPKRYDNPRDTRGRYDDVEDEPTASRTSKAYGKSDREPTRYNKRDPKYDYDSESTVSSISPAPKSRKPKYDDYKSEDKKVDISYGDGRGKKYYEEKEYTKTSYDRDSPKDKYSKPAIYGYEEDIKERRSSRYDYEEAETKTRDRGSSYKSDSYSYGRKDSPEKKEYDRPTSPIRSYDRPTSPTREYDRPTSPVRSYDRPTSPIRSSSYEETKKSYYERPTEEATYTSRTETYTSRPDDRRDDRRGSKIVTVEPGYRRPSAGTSLTVNTPGHSMALTLASAPGSPLLEAYKGTYQSISPMPSPMMMPRSDSDRDVQILDISPLGPLSPSGGRTRHARFHDIPADAARLSRALSGSKHPDLGVLIEILPALTAEQIVTLRVEYKKIVKTGSERKGVNIAKHIKLRLKEEDDAMLKVCYATALGQWESEAYWANFWYHGEKSRRELLIESLMGRTNGEIRAIKAGFSDKKYSDSLVKCMSRELKEDKFKKAVLMVLEEKRMEDRGAWSVDRRLVEEDVRELYRAVNAEKGGETAMINIIVLRSDSHLREVLKLYQASFRQNFAQEMLRKSRNLVVCSIFRRRHVPCFLLLRRGSGGLIVIYRANSSPTSSTASSTGPCATPCSSTTPCNRPTSPIPCAQSCSSRGW
jgi:hypothetical protein